MSSFAEATDPATFVSRRRGVDRREFVVGAAALALGARGVAAHAGRRPPIGLVTADLESRLVAVDIERGRILGYVGTLPYPRSIETVGAVAVVAHPELGVVSIVDGRSLSITHVLRGFGEPRYTAAHPGGRYAFVTDAERGEVVALDTSSRTARCIDLEILAGTDLSRLRLRLNGAAGTLAVTNNRRPVAIVDTRTFQAHAPVSMSGASRQEAGGDGKSIPWTLLWVSSVIALAAVAALLLTLRRRRRSALLRVRAGVSTQAE
jgi:hypothetical protein